MIGPPKIGDAAYFIHRRDVYQAEVVEVSAKSVKLYAARGYVPHSWQRIEYVSWTFEAAHAKLIAALTTEVGLAYAAARLREEELNQARAKTEAIR